jgi:hypothetical protein
VIETQYITSELQQRTFASVARFSVTPAFADSVFFSAKPSIKIGGLRLGAEQ